MKADQLASSMIFMGLGIALLLYPSIFRRWLEARHARRLAKRQARGTDEYFDELRSLEAYSPPKARLIYQGIGLSLFALGASAIVSEFMN